MSDITKLLSAETRHEIRSSHQFIILMPPILVFTPIQGSESYDSEPRGGGHRRIGKDPKYRPSEHRPCEEVKGMTDKRLFLFTR